MTQYGETHRLLVEHEHDGIEDVEVEGGTREAFVSRVLYYIEHPEDCLTESERQRQREEAVRRSNGSINGETEAQSFSGTDGCPVDQEIENVGFMEALGVERYSSAGGEFHRVVEHLREGIHTLNAWFTHYSGPEGDDWDGGLEHEFVSPFPKPPARPIKFELAP